MSIAQRGPFGGGFLHPAFAEVALASGDQRGNFLCRMGLGDRDQGDVEGIALRPDSRGTNRRVNQRQPRVSRIAQNLNAVPT